MKLVRRAAQQVGAGLSLKDFDRVLDEMYGGVPSYTGKLVSQQGALAVSTIWNCVTVLSNDIATLPFVTYQAVEDGREVARQHYLYSLLLDEVNPGMTAFRFKHLMECWRNLWGNAYAEIEISGRGQVVALWPWRPDRVTARRADNGKIFYRYKMNNADPVEVPQDRMLHIRGLGTDGFFGLSPIDVHRQTVGVSLAIQEHGGRFFGNGARPLGVLRHPNSLNDESFKRLKQEWAEAHQGLENAHRVAILEEGMQWQEAGVNMVDAAYIESAGLTSEDICRIYNVPQHRAGLLKHATFSNIEHMGLEYVLYTLRPIAKNWEQEIGFSLLSQRERMTISVRPDYREFLKGDHAAMGAYISNLIDRGVINADEVREGLLDMNPQPNGIGKKYWRQFNMQEVVPGPQPTAKGPLNIPEVPAKTTPGNAADPGTDPAAAAAFNAKANGLLQILTGREHLT